MGDIDYIGDETLITISKAATLTGVGYAVILRRLAEPGVETPPAGQIRCVRPGKSYLTCARWIREGLTKPPEPPLRLYGGDRYGLSR